jgi:hypothetical protein
VPPRPSSDGRRFRGWIDRLADDRWLNAVESFFSAMTRRRLRRGVFRSLVDLQATINRYLAEHNAAPRSFTWTASSASILDKLHQSNASVHQPLGGVQLWRVRTCIVRTRRCTKAHPPQNS